MKIHRLSENAGQLTKYSRVKKHKSFQPTKESFTQVKDLYNDGKHDFDKGYFQSAEKLFAAAIRPALSKPGMKELTSEDSKGLSYEILDSMYHLGLVYLEYASSNNSNYSNPHPKAAAIFQYCAGFSKKHNVSLKLDDGDLGNQQYFLNKAHLVEGNFLKSIQSDTSSSNKFSLNTSTQKTNFYKSKLIKLREVSEQSLKDISDIGVENMSLRADCVEEIYKIINSGFVNHDKDGIIQQLIEDCFKQLGKPPEECKYSIIGLGSLALGTMTPWSDLEFAILVNDEKHKEYFRNLSKLLHIKVINLGETHLRSIGIESLNNFKTDDTKDEWFWDDIMSTGFNFDGAHPHACKLPLGRQGYKGKSNYELIKTPDEMADFQKEEKIYEDKSWFDTDKHLVQALKSVCLIEGDQELLDDYREKASRAVGEDIQKERVLSILQEDLDKFSLKLGDQEEGKLLDVKKDIYRLADRIIISLSQYYSISAEQGEVSLTAWQALEKLSKAGIFSKEGANHLKEALAIATELRLNTYTANKGQQECILTYEPFVEHLSQEQRQQLIEKTFYIKDTGHLKHFYHVMLRVQKLIQLFCNQKSQNISAEFMQEDSLCNSDPYLKGLVYAKFLEYSKAVDYLEHAAKKTFHNLNILQDLLVLYGKTANFEKAVTLTKRIQDDIKTKNLTNYNISVSYNNLGTAYAAKGDNDKAIMYFNKALKKKSSDWSDKIISYINLGIVSIRNSQYDMAINYCNKALDAQLALHTKTYYSYKNLGKIYNNLGVVYLYQGLYNNAEKYCKKAISVYLKIYDKTPNQVDVAKIYNILGSIYLEMGQYDLSIKYSNNSLQIISTIYKEILHPDIAQLYNNLGLAYEHKSEHEIAVEYYNLGLKILYKAYGVNSKHPDIAKTYNNIGLVYFDQGSQELAEEYYQKAFCLSENANKENSNHSDIANFYNNWGTFYLHKGEYLKSIEYYEKVSKIYSEIHKKNPNHPKIATNHNNLGSAYKYLGMYDKVIEHYNKSLEIYLNAYTQNPNHSHIANIYNNLGGVYSRIKRYDRAFEYCNKALNIYYKIYSDNHIQPSLANTYNSVGIIKFDQTEYDAAIYYFTKSLNIYCKAYEKNPNHPEIARVYNNLGNAFSGKEEQDQALEYHLKSLSIYHEYDSNLANTDLANTYNCLGTTYLRKNEYEEAIGAYKKCLDIYTRIYKNFPHYLSFVQIYNNLATTYLFQGNYKEANCYFVKILEIYHEFKNNNDILVGEIKSSIQSFCSYYITQIINLSTNKFKLSPRENKLNLIDIQDHVCTLESLALDSLLDKDFDNLYIFDKQIFIIYRDILFDHSPRLNLAINNLANSSILNGDFKTFEQLHSEYNVHFDKNLLCSLEININQIKTLQEPLCKVTDEMEPTQWTPQLFIPIAIGIIYMCWYFSYIMEVNLSGDNYDYHTDI